MPASLTDPIGLTVPEAAGRLNADGPNELPASKRHGLVVTLLEIVREPMFMLLLGSAVIYFVLGDVGEASALLGSVVLILGITIYQERKTTRALEALRDLTSPRALVIRDGARQRIAGRDVVRGDLLVLAEGNRVPADAALLSCSSLLLDESILTGESVPVHKRVWDHVAPVGAPGGEDLPFVYSGTLIVRGQGLAEVQATGARTAIGGIGKALSRVPVERTLLQQETGRIARTLAVVALAVCTVVVILYGLMRGAWLNGLLAGITLAMSLLPEEFPVVLTVFLALGAWRLSKHRVLTRRVPAIESLGAATVLCVDKTGTLTLNRMAVARLFANGQSFEADRARGGVPQPVVELLDYAALASEPEPHDPTEQAIKELAAPPERSGWTLVQAYPLTPASLAVTHLWRLPDGTIRAASKGAPEAIAALCRLSEPEQRRLRDAIAQMADDGLRVLGVAKAAMTAQPPPEDPRGLAFEFLGLIGLADPVRPGAHAALEDCHAAGIRVIMVTGDYRGTAQAIGRQIGMEPSVETLTGPELGAMSPSELQRRIRTVQIFARVVPEQKLQLVNALKANGEVVAMTGDGVNDAPALQAAHIGIAMGGRGTDVAREAASLVLLDDDFGSIVLAIRQGRRVFDNIRKAMAYLLAAHVPIAGLALIPLIAGWPMVFSPVHIVFLELIIDPACSIVFEAEPEEADVMRRPPHDPARPLFDRRTIAVSLLQGISVLLIVLAVFAIALARRQGAEDARALTFTTLIIANLGLIFTNRSWSRPIIATLRSPNAALWWVAGGAWVFLGLILYVPVLRALFHFSLLHPIDLAICLIAGVASILWFEALKVFGKWHAP